MKTFEGVQRMRDDPGGGGRGSRESRAPAVSLASGRDWVEGLAAMLLVTAVWACGGSDPHGGGPGSGTVAAVEHAVTGVDACELLSEREVEAAVGNPVQSGEHNVGSHLCLWDTATLEEVNVVLSVVAAGSPTERQLCAELRPGPGATSAGVALAEVGNVARWKFRQTPFGASAELVACGDRGWVSFTLAGKGEEETLREAARSLAVMALSRL